jgi:hypothetical protein
MQSANRVGKGKSNPQSRVKASFLNERLFESSCSNFRINKPYLGRKYLNHEGHNVEVKALALVALQISDSNLDFRLDHARSQGSTCQQSNSATQLRHPAGFQPIETTLSYLSDRRKSVAEKLIQQGNQRPLQCLSYTQAPPESQQCEIFSPFRRTSKKQNQCHRFDSS